MAFLKTGKMGNKTTLAALLVVVFALVLGACSEDGSGITLPDGVTLPEVELPQTTDAPESTEAPETTEAPEPTQAPETTQAPQATQAPQETTSEDDGDSSTLWAIGLLALVLIGIIAFFASRSGKTEQTVSVQAPPTAAPTPVGWRDSARSAYAESRWLYDEMDVELGTWRGDTLYEAQISSSTAAINTTHQAAWNQLPNRMSGARDALYKVESTVGDPHIAHLATVLGDNLNTTRAALDRVADARRHRRSVADDPAAAAGALDEARAAESRAADELSADRRRLGDSISNLSAVI